MARLFSSTWTLSDVMIGNITILIFAVFGVNGETSN